MEGTVGLWSSWVYLLFALGRRFLTCANRIGRVNRRCPAHAGPVCVPTRMLGGDSAEGVQR